MNQNSPLLTSQQNWNTSVINVRVFPIFVKQEELISRAGSFCGFGQVGGKFAGNWIRWRSKVELKVFQEIPLNLSNRLTCVGTVWCFFGVLVFEAIHDDFFGPEMRKRNDLLSLPNFLLFFLFCSLFTEFLSQSSRIFSEFLAMISTTLWLTWIDKNFSVCWTARLIWLEF